MENRFGPIDRIHQALHAYHVVADERGSLVPSVHYCACNPSDDRLQCLIYDSDRPDAKLIGVEYMVSETIFASMPAEEKPYWHSHDYEVMGGSLVLIGIRAGATVQAAASVAKTAQDAVQSFVGGGATGGPVPDEFELAALRKIREMYGKAIHLWHPPDSDVPLGAPKLMMPVDPNEGVPEELIAQRDHEYSVDSKRKKIQRQEHITEPFVPNPAADQYAHSGVVPQFNSESRPVHST